MTFKKYNPLIKAILQEKNIIEPNLLQTKILSKIKGGSNLFTIAPKNAGKTTALIISTLQKLEMTSRGDSPRAIILVKDKAEALKLEQTFLSFIKDTDLRIYAVNEEENINVQKDNIYYGIDIIIATPKRLSKIYFLNGIHLGELQLLIVEDADFLIRNSFHTDVARLSESVIKCQHLFFAEQFNSKLKFLQESVYTTAPIIEL